MPASRRGLLKAALAAPVFSGMAPGATKPGIPGPFRGRVVEVHHPGSILAGEYQATPVRAMLRKGMTELTGAPSWTDAWRVLFEKGDVVAIKVCPVGGPNLCSDALVLHQILDGLKEAGVSMRDVIVFNRYRQEMMEAGIHKWVPDGIRWDAASPRNTPSQLDMEGYDQDQYMEMALIKPGESETDPHFRRSYVAKVITQQVNKIINLPVLKHHQSAGVTIALKNLSHGLVNNVNRSHLTPDGERVRHFHSDRGEPAGDPQQGRAPHLRCSESLISRRPQLPPAVRMGTQDDVLRHRSGRSGSRRVESD